MVEAPRLQDSKPSILMYLFRIIAPAILAFVVSGPCGAISITAHLSVGVNEMAREYLAEHKIQSRLGVLFVGVKNASELTNRYDVGSMLDPIVEKCLVDSLVFRMIDRRSLDSVIREIELSLADPNRQVGARAKTILEASYILTGKVSDVDGEFTVMLELHRADSNIIVADSTIVIPMSELLAADEYSIKPFGFLGPWITANFDPYALGQGSTYGDILMTGGVALMIPFKNLYTRFGVLGIKSEAEYVPDPWWTIEASGINRILAVTPYCGLGLVFPVGAGRQVHGGLDLGFGIDRRQVVTEDAGVYLETDYSKTEGCIYWMISTGFAARIADRWCIDLQGGIGGFQFGVVSQGGYRSNGVGLIPLSVSVAYVW